MKKACVILSLLMMCSCDVQNKDNRCLFNVDDINLNLSFKDIEKKGFKRVVVDVFMYEKQEKDTLIIFQLDNEINKYKINTKTWKIKLKSNSKQYVKNQIIDKAYIVTPISDNNSKGYFFTVVDMEYSNTFVCKVIEEDNIHFLYVTYYNPYRQINKEM